MTSSKDRQFLARLHRAKSNIAGAWGCRSGEDYISPSPRGRRQKKREKASKKKESEELKASQRTRLKSDRLSLEGLALEFPRDGNSKRTEKDSPTTQDKTNWLQPASQRHHDDFNPWGEYVGRPKSGKGKEKADTELETSYFERDALQDVHQEIVEVMDENEASSSMHHSPEEDSRPTDPLKSGSTKPINFGQNTKAVKAGAQGGFEDLRFEDRLPDCRPAGFQRAFSSNSEIEEVEVSDNLNKDSETLREEGDRKIKEESRLHHSVGGVPEEKVQPGIERSESPRDHYTQSLDECSATGKAGQNVVIPNSGERHELQEAEGEKVKTLEQHESPVSVLSGALGSGRWADFDSANNTPYPGADSRQENEEFKSPSHDRQVVFSKFSDLAKPGKEIGTRQPDSENLQHTEDESLEALEGKNSHHLRQDFATANSHATGKDEIEGMGSLSGDYPAVFSEKEEAENKIEPNHPPHYIPGKESGSGDFKPESSQSLEQASKDASEHSSQDLTEKSRQEEMVPMVQNRNPADSTGPSDGREGPSLDREREAQNSDNLQNVEGQKMQDGLHQKRIPDGGLIAPHNDISPEADELGELPTGDGNGKANANGDHHDGTHDPYKGVAGSTKLNGITAAGKDDRASIYGAGEDRSSHLYADPYDYTGLHDRCLGQRAAQLACAEEPPAWKFGFFSVPHVLAVGALTVLTVLGKAASN